MKEKYQKAPWLVIPATVVGECACELANRKYHGKIIGVTSRGIFIKFENKNLIFLSFEKFTGPLTINLNQKLVDSIQYLKEGQSVQFTEHLLNIPEAKIQIDMCSSSNRTNAINKNPIGSAPDYIKNLTLLIDTAMKGFDKSKLIKYLPQLLHSVRYKSLANVKGNQNNEIDRLRYAYRTGSIRDLFNSFSKLIGRGQGLTPSGDDLILGITLLINRWKDKLILPFDINDFNRKVISLAFNETTLLSANLIKCAGEGRGDERMESLADSIFAEDLPQLELVRTWLSWGSTSGVDAFVGMAIAVVENYMVNSVE